MPPTGYFVDTNLFVLFVVGSESRDLVSRHRRLRDYTATDYDILRGLLDQVSQRFVTPNTLTETSNLLGQHVEPERSMLFRRLRTIIQDSREVVIASMAAASNREFERLGLTDVALLEAINADTPLLTVDFRLYRAALEKGADTVVNFSAYRDM